MSGEKPERKRRTKVTPAETQLVLLDMIEPMIKTIRNQKVLLDSDIAKLYGVTTKRLNEQVRRNRGSDTV